MGMGILLTIHCGFLTVSVVKLYTDKVFQIVPKCLILKAYAFKMRQQFACVRGR